MLGTLCQVNDQCTELVVERDTREKELHDRGLRLQSLKAECAAQRERLAEALGTGRRGYGSQLALLEAERHRPPTGVVTICHTSIQHTQEMWTKDPEPMLLAVRRCFEILRTELAKCDGCVPLCSQYQRRPKYKE